MSLESILNVTSTKKVGISEERILQIVPIMR
jgi:hypothetical protein